MSPYTISPVWSPSHEHYSPIPIKGTFHRLPNSPALSADVELIRLLREAEQHRFTAEELQAALTHCGSASPITWLLENWPKLIETVQNLSTKYGQERKENIIGTISAVESRDALRMHKGNVWHAVTECIQQRQRKFNEIMCEGSYAREDVVWALTAHQGSLDLAIMDLAKSKQIRPFMMKVWGPPTGVENDSGNRMELAEESIAIQQFINDNLDQSMTNPSAVSDELAKPTKMESDFISLETADNSPSILRDIEKLIGNMELKQSQQNEDMLHNIENILGLVLAKHSASRPMSSASNFSLNSIENSINVKSPLPVDSKSMQEQSNEHADQVQQNVRAFMEQHIQDVSPDLVEYVENDLEMYDYMNRGQFKENLRSHGVEELNELELEEENKNDIIDETNDQRSTQLQVSHIDQNQSLAIQLTGDHFQEMDSLPPILSQTHEDRIESPANIFLSAENHINTENIAEDSFTKSPSHSLSVKDELPLDNNRLLKNVHEVEFYQTFTESKTNNLPQINDNHKPQNSSKPPPSRHTEGWAKEEYELNSPNALIQEIKFKSPELPVIIGLEESTEQISSNNYESQSTLNKNSKERKILTTPSNGFVETKQVNSINYVELQTSSTVDEVNPIQMISVNLSKLNNSTQNIKSPKTKRKYPRQHISESADIKQVEHVQLPDQENQNYVNASLSALQKSVPIRRKLIVLPQMLLHDSEENIVEVKLTNGIALESRSKIVEKDLSLESNNVNIAANQIASRTQDPLFNIEFPAAEPKITSLTSELVFLPKILDIMAEPETINIATLIASKSTIKNAEIPQLSPNKAKTNKKRRNRKSIVVSYNLEPELSVTAMSEQLVKSTLEKAEEIAKVSRVSAEEHTNLDIPYDVTDYINSQSSDELVHVSIDSTSKNSSIYISDESNGANLEADQILYNESTTETIGHLIDLDEEDNNQTHQEIVLYPDSTPENLLNLQRNFTEFDFSSSLTMDTPQDRMQDNQNNDISTSPVQLTTDYNIITESGSSSSTILDRTHIQDLNLIIDNVQLMEHESERSLSPTSTINASCIDDSEYSDSETEAVFSVSSVLVESKLDAVQMGDKNTQNLSEMVIDTRKLIQQMKDEINSDIASFVSDDSECEDSDDDYTDYDESYSDDEGWEDEEVTDEEEADEIDEETINVVENANGVVEDAEEEDWTDEGDSEYYEETEKEIEQDIENCELRQSEQTISNGSDRTVEVEVDLSRETYIKIEIHEESDGSESEYYEEEVLAEVVLDEYPELIHTNHIEETEPILPPMEFLDANSPEPFYITIDSHADESNQIIQSESFSNDSLLQLQQQSQHIDSEFITNNQPETMDPEESVNHSKEHLAESFPEMASGNNDNDLLLETIRAIQQHDSLIQTIQKSLSTSSTLIASVSSTNNNDKTVSEVGIPDQSLAATEILAVVKDKKHIDTVEDVLPVDIEIKSTEILANNKFNDTDNDTTITEHQAESGMNTDIPSNFDVPIKNAENFTDLLDTSIPLEATLSSSQTNNNTSQTEQNSTKTVSSKKTASNAKAPTKVASKKIPIRKASLPGIFGPLGTTNVRAMQQEFLNKQPDNGKPSKIVPPKIYKKPGSISSSLTERITKFIKPFTTGNESKEIVWESSRSGANVPGGSGSVATGNSNAGASGKTKIPKKKYHETCFSDDYQSSEDDENVPVVVATKRRMPLRQQSMPNIMRLDLDDEESFEVINISQIIYSKLINI